MVDFIREIVSGKKKRFTNEGFNLDLSYITDRIIAMAFPSTGFESMYRNDIGDVAKLLNKNHGDNYLVINLSGRPYGYEKFGNRVTDYAWEDHHSPAMDILFAACKQIHEYLQKDVKNVVVIHCLAGKGRTGTLICCYLLYSGRFATTQEALYYYKKRRFQNGGGVTQPSQIRYVKYFGEVFHGYIQRHFVHSPLVVRVDKMVIHGTPRISSGYFRPYVEIYSVRDKVLTYTNKNSNNLKKYATDEDYENTKIEIPFANLNNNLIMTGDILIKVHHMATLGTNLAFRFGFNTAFLESEGPEQTVLEFPLTELDPDKRKDDERFPLNFKVELHMNIISLPPRLKDPMYHTILNQLKREEPHWDNIYKILKDYKIPSALDSSIYLFGNPLNDNVEEILNTNKMLHQQRAENNHLHQRQDSQESESDSNNSSSNEGESGFQPSNTGRPRFVNNSQNSKAMQRFSLQHIEPQNPTQTQTKSLVDVELTSKKTGCPVNGGEDDSPKNNNTAPVERGEIALTQIPAVSVIKEENERNGNVDSHYTEISQVSQ